MSGFTATKQGHNGGYYIQRLEEAFRDYFGVKYAVAMNSATACLHSACVALNPYKEEVLVTPYSFSSSASCVLMAGGIPVFGDIDPDTFCLAPQSKSNHLYRLVIPVHLFGHPADLDTFKNDIIIEDCAQAIGTEYKGRKVGTIGECGIFSFNQAKHVNVGEGGMLITNNTYVYAVARAMRNHGEVADPELGIVGYNYRLCEIEAYMALEQFKNLDFIMEEKEIKAYQLTRQLEHIEVLTLPVVKDYCTSHSWYRYAVKLKEGRCNIGELCVAFLDFTRGYVEPLYKLPVYKKFNIKPLPVVEKINKEILLKAL
jgi:dTDP-4-amino-4,6-dideoxygalactose transaminase